MKAAFSETGPETTLNRLKTRIDPFLPKDLRIGEISEIHNVANALHKNAASILRGKFMWNALIAPIAGGSLGSALGPAGATIGVISGMALQQPGILRALIRASAYMTNKELKEFATQILSQSARRAIVSSPGGIRLLQKLLQQR